MISDTHSGIHSRDSELSMSNRSMEETRNQIVQLRIRRSHFELTKNHASGNRWGPFDSQAVFTCCEFSTNNTMLEVFLGVKELEVSPTS